MNTRADWWQEVFFGTMLFLFFVPFMFCLGGIIFYWLSRLLNLI